MSFIEGIFDKAAGFVRDVFNVDDEPKAAPKPAERSKDLAVDSKTTYTKRSTTSTTSASEDTILEGLRRSAAARAQETASTSSRTDAQDTGTVPPHMTFERDTAPPVDATPSATARATAARARVADLARGGATDSDEARVAGANVQKGLDYYARTFGRQGLDGAGAGVDVLVNDRRTVADRNSPDFGKEMFEGNGGYFSLPDANGNLAEAIHFGIGKSYKADRGLVDQASMGYSDDLAIHELTHGVIRKETGHLGGEADEAGATNEGIADVMAAAATRDWSIGEGMYTERSDYKRMRNIADPDDETAIHGLDTTMQQVEQRRAENDGEIEEHHASGVISTVGQRVQSRFGDEAGWQVVEQVFYDTIDNRRLGDMSFQAVAGALRTSAATVYGQGSSVHQVFDEELRRAGL